MDGQGVAFDADINVFFVDARNFDLQRDVVLVFVDVHRRCEAGCCQRLLRAFGAIRLTEKTFMRFMRSCIVENSRKGSQRVNIVITQFLLGDVCCYFFDSSPSKCFSTSPRLSGVFPVVNTIEYDFVAFNLSRGGGFLGGSRAEVSEGFDI
jgi:hypothetical protein